MERMQNIKKWEEEEDKKKYTEIIITFRLLREKAFKQKRNYFGFRDKKKMKKVLM